MEDAENALPSSKKRAAGRQLSRDNPEPEDDEDASEQETGTFKRASDEVLAGRRIVKVRRQVTTAPSSNPFAGIRLVPPSEPSAATAMPPAEEQASNEKVAEDTSGKNEVTDETKDGKDENDKQPESKAEEPVKQEEVGSEPCKQDEEGNESVKQVVPVDESTGGKEKGEVASEETEVKASDVDAARADKTDEQDQKENGTENKDGSDAAPLSSFQQLSSSKNAFTGLAGTGFSSSTFSFGSLSKEGSALGAGSGSLFGLKSDQPFGFGLSNNGSSSIFGAAAASIGTKEGSSFQSLQEVPVETGEENEKAVFTADSVLFEFIDDGWKERGKGELKLNISAMGSGRARLVMRARGNLRLILNANLYPDMKLTNMDKKGITFACMNGTGEGKEGLSTFALKFKDSSMVEEFRGAVMAHKGEPAPSLKTPENSP
ncbi:Ran binding domain [Dillenia turbinata]|uniref:Ran binding domain n=1 Tax=Dillenia turbinata TaxID=194707 RepID=A0AAN8UKX5_9MAGN